MVWSCIVVFLMAMFYEGFKVFREVLRKKYCNSHCYDKPSDGHLVAGKGTCDAHLHQSRYKTACTEWVKNWYSKLDSSLVSNRCSWLQLHYPGTIIMHLTSKETRCFGLFNDSLQAIHQFEQASVFLLTRLYVFLVPHLAKIFKTSYLNCAHNFFFQVLFLQQAPFPPIFPAHPSSCG